MRDQVMVPEQQRGMKPLRFSAAYDIGLNTVYRLLKDKKLPAVQINGRYLILNKRFEEMVAAGEIEFESTETAAARKKPVPKAPKKPKKSGK